MLQTSQDLLFIVLAIAVVWLTVFLCWALYRLAVWMRSMNDLTTDVVQKSRTIDEWFVDMKERFSTAISLVTTLSKGIESALRFIPFGKGAKKRSKSKSESSEE